MIIRKTQNPGQIYALNTFNGSKSFNLGRSNRGSNNKFWFNMGELTKTSVLKDFDWIITQTLITKVFIFSNLKISTFPAKYCILGCAHTQTVIYTCYESSQYMTCKKLAQYSLQGLVMCNSYHVKSVACTHPAQSFGWNGIYSSKLMFSLNEWISKGISEIRIWTCYLYSLVRTNFK